MSERFQDNVAKCFSSDFNYNSNVCPWFLFSLVDYILNIFKKSFFHSLSFVVLGASKINITTKVKPNQKIIYFCKLKINKFFYQNQGLMSFFVQCFEYFELHNFIIYLFVFEFLVFEEGIFQVKKKNLWKNSPHFILILILGQIVTNSFTIIIICYKNVAN
jgi:hypothetical protein